MKYLYVFAALIAGGFPLCAQVAPSAQTMQASSVSLKAAVQKQSNVEVHMVYVHGIGMSGPNTSADLRRSLCKHLGGCVSRNTWKERYVAHLGTFDPKTVPSLSYMGTKIWESKDDWAAAAPFVDRYELQLKTGKTLVLDELNWWPLVMSVKCRGLVWNETYLAGKWDKYLDICEGKTKSNDPHGDAVGHNALAHNWIPAPKMAIGDKTSPHFSRDLKVNIMDWRFTDALLGVGRMEDYMVEGIRELLLHAVTTQATTGSPGSFTVSDPNVQFTAVSHSLGSFLLFSAIHSELDRTKSERNASTQPTPLEAMLQRLGLVEMLANQIPLLEAAKLSRAEDSQSFQGLQDWCNQRKIAAGRDVTKGSCHDNARLIAWSDAADLLTFYLGQDFIDWQSSGNTVSFENRRVVNGLRWPWLYLFESPSTAHTAYDKNSKVIKELLISQ